MNLSVSVSRVRGGRPYQEDSYRVAPRDGEPLFAVADGMGGHAAGDVASATACRVLVEVYEATLYDSGTPEDRIRHAFQAANAAVRREEGEAVQSRRGMGTTLCALAFDRGAGDALIATIANVGDSRCYLLRAGSFRRLTRDHTLVQNLANEGRITQAQADASPRRHILSRAVGTELAVDVDVFRRDARLGDTFLLCSDGLHGALSDGRIAEMLDDGAGAEELTRAAEDAGADDNVTAIVVRL